MSAHGRGASKLRNRSLGALFIALLVLGVWVVYAVFGQKFTSWSTVSLHTDTAGLQLPVRADVKVRGVIVGELLEAKAENGGATLKLGIDPAKISTIPRNVSASILPKTLFGEKYVEFNVPENASSSGLRAGDQIAQTQLPIELEKLLNDIYPLLTAVEPAQLSYTLNAMATALDGRGDQLGNGLENLNSYLVKLDPHLPALMQDLSQLATVSGTYADVVPQIADTLRNTVTTGRTFTEKSAEITQFLREFTAFSNTAKSFLDANGNNLVQLSQVSAPVISAIAAFSPEFVCLSQGLEKEIPLLDSAFRGHMLHIDLFTLPSQPRGYNTGDKPVFGDGIARPDCAGLPNPPNPYPGGPNLRDGVDDFGGTLGRGDGQRVAPGFGLTSALGTDSAHVGALVAPLVGDGSSAAGLAALLYGPVTDSSAVSGQ